MRVALDTSQFWWGWKRKYLINKKNFLMIQVEFAWNCLALIHTIIEEAQWVLFYFDDNYTPPWCPKSKSVDFSRWPPIQI